MHRRSGAGDRDIPAISLLGGRDRLGVPAMGRNQWTLMRPIVKRTRKPLSKRAPLPHSLKLKEWQRVQPLKRGKPAFLPRERRRKNA
jgi:hypothetical protein